LPESGGVARSYTPAPRGDQLGSLPCRSSRVRVLSSSRRKAPANRGLSAGWSASGPRSVAAMRGAIARV